MNQIISDLFSVYEAYMSEQRELVSKFEKIVTNYKKQIDKEEYSQNERKKVKQENGSEKEKLVCPHCDKTYTSKLPYKNHLEKMHQQDIQQHSRYGDSYGEEGGEKTYYDDQVKNSLQRNVQAIRKGNVDDKNRQTEVTSDRESDKENLVLSGLDSDFSKNE